MQTLGMLYVICNCGCRNGINDCVCFCNVTYFNEKNNKKILKYEICGSDNEGIDNREVK